MWRSFGCHFFKFAFIAAATILVALTNMLTSASAAPPASCAHKFVGVWSYAGGTTRVNANGTANPTCPMCVAVQTWTCSGNTYIITGPTSYTATLTPDGRQVVGSAGIATRIGGRAVAAKTEPREHKQAKQEVRNANPQKVAANQQAASQPQPQGQSRKIDDGCTAEFPIWSNGAACNGSDVFGKISTGNVTACCLRNPNGSSASTNPNAPKPQAVLRTQPTTQPTTKQTAASTIPILPSVSSGGTRVEINSGEPSRVAASGAGSCVPYFLKMRDQFLTNAAMCLKETRLLQSLTDSVEVGDRHDGIGDPTFTRTSAPELYGQIRPNDAGWTKSDDKFTANCAVPLNVTGQDQSFSECARVYMCSAEAATCGIRKASQSKTEQCVPISQSCLAEHPVPKRGVAATEAQPVLPTPPDQSPQPRPPSPYSGISESSSPGAGAKSSGAGGDAR